jgi:hypothetical protein
MAVSSIIQVIGNDVTTNASFTSTPTASTPIPVGVSNQTVYINFTQYTGTILSFTVIFNLIPGPGLKVIGNTTFTTYVNPNCVILNKYSAGIVGDLVLGQKGTIVNGNPITANIPKDKSISSWWFLNGLLYNS